jgi:hypothetical protein
VRQTHIGCKWDLREGTCDETSFGGCVANLAMPTATPRVPWDDTGAEHYGQDEDAPHPLVEFPSPLMPAIHGMLLYPYAHDHSPGLLLSPAAHYEPDATCTAYLGCRPCAAARNCTACYARLDMSYTVALHMLKRIASMVKDTDEIV